MAYANPAGIIDMFHVVGEDYPPKDRHSDRFSVVVRLIYKKDGSRDNGRYDFELKQWQYFTYDGSSKAIAESRIILWCGYSVSLFCGGGFCQSRRHAVSYLGP